MHKEIGFSNLQKKILDILKDGKELYRTDISPMIYDGHPTKSQIVDLSRAIHWLHNRGLIDIYCYGSHTGPCPALPNGGFMMTAGYSTTMIQISARGAACLREEELPPLETGFKQMPGKCWCGKNLPVAGEGAWHHRQLPREWKIEIANV
jgi:hypothetical protein